jgi:hypothetical protein
MSINNGINIADVQADDFEGTGSISFNSYKTITFPFEQYVLTIKLTLDNKFVEVLEIKINRDFLSHKQKMSSLHSIDIESYLEP